MLELSVDTAEDEPDRAGLRADGFFAIPDLVLLRVIIPDRAGGREGWNRGIHSYLPRLGVSQINSGQEVVALQPLDRPEPAAVALGVIDKEDSPTPQAPDLPSVWQRLLQSLNFHGAGSGARLQGCTGWVAKKNLVELEP